MPILLSDDELDALEGLPHLHRCLYIFGIRRYMDYQTGITGIKRKISYKSLSEEIYVTPHQGFVDSGAKGREAMRRAVKALERSGLITIKSSSKNLILECCLAKSDKSVQNKPDTNPTPKPDMKADTSKTLKTSENTSGPITKPDTQADIHPTRQPDTHPVSDITKLNCTVLHDFLSTDENRFLNLFTDMKLNLKPAGDLKAITSAKALVAAGVTLEVASQALKIKIEAYYEKYPNGKTPHPSYFTDAILDYHRDLEAIKQKPEETNNHERIRTRTIQAKPDRRAEAYKRLAKWAEKREQEELTDD
jgi:hypothetical protein